jgi:hypothetical protein
VAKKDPRSALDIAILSAITGLDNPFDGDISIEEDYLLREKMENLRESGFPVPEEFLPTERTAYEKREYRERKWMEGIEDSRTRRVMEWEQCDTDFEEYVPEPLLQKVVIV